MVLTEAETEPYRQFTEGYLQDLAPVGVQETALVHSVMNNRWRVNQIAAMESTLYALGQREHAAQFSSETPEMAAAMARLLTFQQKRTEFDRLRRYESALTRQINKDMATLTELQNNRKARAAQQEKEAIALLTHFTTTGKSWNPADFGFDLSIDQI
jgi:Tfp pilus assembly pilus retraction ATPase PilT